LRATFPGAAEVMANTATETRNMVNSINNNLRKMNFVIQCSYRLPPAASRFRTDRDRQKIFQLWLG
jgi:hypothetical protein